MQTFLPSPLFAESARMLDRQRLGKQRVEAKQILMCLLGTGSTRWRNHPAVKMWAGRETALASYGFLICHEWQCRGYKDTLRDWFKAQLNSIPGPLVMPDWLNDPAFHLSHQSNLLRKLPEHYSQFWPGVPDDLPYIWPAGAA